MPGRMQRASNAGICGDGALETGAQPCRFIARRATNGAPPSEATQPKRESRRKCGFRDRCGSVTGCLMGSNYAPAWITARMSASRSSAEWTWWGIVEL
jgi:hypothetical protein